MTKYAVVDFRMRTVEKEYIKSLGYEIIENGFNLNTYDEIASHVDIYYLKVGDMVFSAPEKKGVLPFNTVSCTTPIGREYPQDVPYNVCIIGKNAIHKFDYTDNIVKFYLERHGYNLINVEQGYANCSTCVLSENSCIASDMGIAKALMENDIDTLYVCEPDIKLKKRLSDVFKEQSRMSFIDSKMQGFIGGAMARLGDTVILFGDVANLVNGTKIMRFIEKKGLKFHYFEGLDIVDYGGVLEVNINE